MYKHTYLGFAAMSALAAGFSSPTSTQLVDGPIIYGQRAKHHGWDRKKNGESPRAAMRRKSRSRAAHAAGRRRAA